MARMETVAGSAYWASYLINGDDSGITENERTLADAWLERHGGSVVSCDEEAYFSWSYDLHTGADAQGGDLLDYTLRYDA